MGEKKEKKTFSGWGVQTCQISLAQTWLSWALQTFNVWFPAFFSLGTEREVFENSITKYFKLQSRPVSAINSIPFICYKLTVQAGTCHMRAVTNLSLTCICSLPHKHRWSFSSSPALSWTLLGKQKAAVWRTGTWLGKRERENQVWKPNTKSRHWFPIRGAKCSNLLRCFGLKGIYPVIATTRRTVVRWDNASGFVLGPQILLHQPQPSGLGTLLAEAAGVTWSLVVSVFLLWCCCQIFSYRSTSSDINYPAADST